jgi:hypothetical protein
MRTGMSGGGHGRGGGRGANGLLGGIAIAIAIAAAVFVGTGLPARAYRAGECDRQHGDSGCTSAARQWRCSETQAHGRS